MRATHSLAWRNESGQVVPMVTVMLPTLLLFVALVVNVGQAVNRRVAVQFLADTSAFTGATVLAVHLNQMAWTNKQLQRAWVLLTYSTGFFKVSPLCAVNDVAVGLYHPASIGMRGMISVFNSFAGWRADFEGERVALGPTGNQPELFPGEDPTTFDYDSNTFSLLSPLPSAIDIEEVPEGTDPVAAEGLTLPIPDWLETFLSISYEARKSPIWACIPAWAGPIPAGALPRTPSIPIPFFTSFRLWVQEKGEPETYVAYLTAPEVPARMFPGIFGKIPKMRAAAAAKPIGGSIAEGRPEYIVKMVPVSTADLPVDIVQAPFPLRFILH